MTRLTEFSLLFGLLICVVAGRSAADTVGTCTNDMKRRVQAGNGCFAVDIVGHPEFEPGQPLVVFMHGDSGASKDGNYLKNYKDQFQRLKRKHVNVLTIARPAYWLPNGPTTGIHARFNRDPYTVPVVDGLAAALKALKAHYRPSRLVLLGHSGGSMISGIILGRHPGLVSGAVLVAWACDTREWRQWRIESAGKRSQWYESLSARDYIANVPATTKVIAITGQRDRNTLPKFSKKCVKEMKSHGIDARFKMVSTPRVRGHGSVMRSSVVTRAVLEVSGMRSAKSRTNSAIRDAGASDRGR